MESIGGPNSVFLFEPPDSYSQFTVPWSLECKNTSFEGILLGVVIFLNLFLLGFFLFSLFDELYYCSDLSSRVTIHLATFLTTFFFYYYHFDGGSQLLQQILWNKFHIRCAYFTTNCTWSPNYSVLVFLVFM
jgi:hypothetical protein